MIYYLPHQTSDLLDQIIMLQTSDNKKIRGIHIYPRSSFSRLSEHTTRIDGISAMISEC